MKIGIYGYGNLGKAVERAIEKNPDMELEAVFSRREPDKIGAVHIEKVKNVYDILRYRDKIDVMIVCNGSTLDLPKQTHQIAKNFNLVDAFDTHQDIPVHFDKVDNNARLYGNTCLICAGWDPGLFSVMREMCSAILPEGQIYTFWGEGVSQGHTEAIKNVYGVKMGVQYTVPDEKSMNKIKNGELVDGDTKKLHKRVCYIVPQDNADLTGIESTIKNMPGYFQGYNTEFHYVTEEEFEKSCLSFSHSGNVIANENSGSSSSQIALSVSMSSNPDFTAGILLAYARAVFKMNSRGETGCKTVFDICPKDLSPLTEKELRDTYL